MRVCFSLESLCLALWAHRDASSVLLFMQRGSLSVLAIHSFSVRQRSQYLPPFLYMFPLLSMDHLMFGSGPSPSSHMCVESVVACFFLSSLNDALWFACLSLKFCVEPMYICSVSVLSLKVTVWKT